MVTNESASSLPRSLDDEHCYQIISARDRRYDGRFFTAVLTTGVYCRPICPARTPRRVNVRFFACAAAAEQAGFRPCRRCRPDAAPGTPAWAGSSGIVARALRLIGGGALDGGGVEELAARLGVGGRHLRRLFDEHLGVGPHALAATRRAHFARRLLDETTLGMTDVAFGAGYRSVRQFNDAMRATFGRPPRELRRDGLPIAAGRLRLRLPYRPPYDWPALVGFLAPRATPGVELIDPSGYRRTARIDGQACIVHVSPGREGEHLVLTVDAAAGRHLLPVVDRARRLFDLDADPLSIAAHLARDESRRSSPLAALLAARVRRWPGLRVPGAWDPFELAVRAVLGQQVTVRGATTLAGRLVQRFGEATEVDGASSVAGESALAFLFPTADALADARLPAIAAIGLPRARAQTIHELARAVRDEPDWLDAGADVHESMRRLLSIRGIGAWTAQYIAMRALGEPDAFPSGDLGLRRVPAAGGGRGDTLTPAALERVAAIWSPWRAYAAMHLWHRS